MILPKSHSESSVNPENITATCQKCHEDASIVFSKSYSHKSQNEEAAYVESIVETIYFWLIVLVIGGMVVHNLLIFVYEITEKKEAS